MLILNPSSEILTKEEYSKHLPVFIRNLIENRALDRVRSLPPFLAFALLLPSPFLTLILTVEMRRWFNKIK